MKVLRLTRKEFRRKRTRKMISALLAIGVQLQVEFVR
jgi:hypothetical protein